MNENDELIDGLEKELYGLAGQWRLDHSQENFEKATYSVNKYFETMERLWNLGWRGDDLSPTAELPDRLMPKYFLEYWRRKNNV